MVVVIRMVAFEEEFVERDSEIWVELELGEVIEL